jgi:hypothetical protein
LLDPGEMVARETAFLNRRIAEFRPNAIAAGPGPRGTKPR